MRFLWHLLPDDQLIEILSWCGFHERRALAATCKRMHNLVRSEEYLHVSLHVQGTPRVSLPPMGSQMGSIRVRDDKFTCAALLNIGWQHQYGDCCQQLATATSSFVSTHTCFWFRGDVTLTGKVALENCKQSDIFTALPQLTAVFEQAKMIQIGASLTDLTLRNTILPEGCPLNSVECPCLISLQLWDCQILGSAEAALAALPKLQKLATLGSEVSTAVIVLSNLLPQLTKLALDVHDHFVMPTGAAHSFWRARAADMQQLVLLDADAQALYDTQIYSTLLGSVATGAWAHLTELYLQSGSWQDPVLKRFLAGPTIDGGIAELLYLLPSLTTLGQINLSNIGTAAPRQCRSEDYFFTGLPLATEKSPARNLRALYFYILDSQFPDGHPDEYCEWGVGGTLAAIVRGVNARTPWVDHIYVEWYAECYAPIAELAATLAPLQRSRLEPPRTVHLIPYVGGCVASTSCLWSAQPFPAEEAQRRFARALPGLTVRVRESSVADGRETIMSVGGVDLEGDFRFGQKIAARGLLADGRFYPDG